MTAERGDKGEAFLQRWSRRKSAARQPEAAKEIASGPFIFAILLEGAAIIALVFALLLKIL